MCFAVAGVCATAVETRLGRARGLGPRGYACYNVYCVRNDLSDLFEYRNGPGIFAGYRRAAAAYERGAFGNPLDIYRDRICGQHQNAAVRQLGDFIWLGN
jgi:hypothetical protein